ncbi:MAG: helix-turn-helix transcriptional regulator [Pirellulales bacterium]|nr:helix-turn-helix transcriptional regulator [Pirellulales bacterium]
MTTYARENLQRLMAAGGLSMRRVVEQTGLNARTVRGILHGGQKPRARTLHRLAHGLGVDVDEFFVDPSQLLYRRFDRRKNPVVSEVIEKRRDLFRNWSEADFDKLHNHLDGEKTPTVDETLDAVNRINSARLLHERLDLLLESPYAEIAAGMIGVLFEKTFLRERGERRGERE